MERNCGTVWNGGTCSMGSRYDLEFLFIMSGGYAIMVVYKSLVTKGNKMTIEKKAKCVHHFMIPTPPARPMGVCKKCGEKRLHSNSGNVVGWNNRKFNR